MYTEQTQSNPPSSAGSKNFNPINFVRLMRSAGGAIFAQASLHSQLASVEWAEEKTRLMNMAIAALSGFVFLLCFMIFIGVLVMAFTWETQYRIAGVAIMTAIYAAGAFFALQRFKSLAALSSQAFAATRKEIAADIALIKSRL